MPELGFGAITEDLKILNDDSPVSEAPSATPEIEQAPEVAPSEAAPETATEPEGQINETEFFRAYPQYKETFITLKKNLAEYDKFFGSVKGAREFLAQVKTIGGPEKIKELRAHEEKVKATDGIYYNGSREEKEQFLSELHQQNPGAFFSAVSNGLELIRARNPEEYAYITAPVVAETLKQDKIGHWLEFIRSELQSKPGLEEVSKLFNQFAAGFGKYGIGPRVQETPEFVQRRTAFLADVGNMAGEQLDSATMKAITFFAPHVTDLELQSQIVDQVRAELLNSMKNLSNLKHVLSNLTHMGMSKSVGNKLGNLLVSKLLPYIPSAVKRFAGAPPKETKPAAANGKPAPARNGASPRKARLSQREANQMTFSEIVNDSREGEARQ